MSEYRKQLDEVLTQRRLAVKAAKEAKVALEEAEKGLALAEEAQGLLQEIAQQVQEQAHRKIATVVTKCLRTVFEDGAYDFQIEFERKRGKTEAKLLFLRDGNAFDPLEETSIGAVDLAAFGIRLAALTFRRPPLRKLLVLDEPFKHVARQNAGRVAQLLSTMSEELGIQILMVTHSKALRCGLTYRLSADGVIEEIET